jgi:hypothetical protein
LLGHTVTLLGHACYGAASICNGNNPTLSSPRFQCLGRDGLRGRGHQDDFFGGSALERIAGSSVENAVSAEHHLIAKSLLSAESWDPIGIVMCLRQEQSESFLPQGLRQPNQASTTFPRRLRFHPSQTRRWNPCHFRIRIDRRTPCFHRSPYPHRNLSRRQS